MKTAADILIFDVDGVLIDTCDSYCLGTAGTIRWWWRNVLEGVVDCEGYNLEYFRTTKTHPSFNDDVDIAWAILRMMVKRAGDTKDMPMSQVFPSLQDWAGELRAYDGLRVRNEAARLWNERLLLPGMCGVFEELYYGHEQYARLKGRAFYGIKGEGLWRRERPGTSRSWHDLPLPVGIYTGRTLAEMELGRDILAWQDFPEERVVSASSGIMKPSPDGFEVLCGRLGAQTPLYFGDTASDKAAWSNFGRGTFVAIGDILPDEPLRFDTLDEAFNALL